MAINIIAIRDQVVGRVVNRVAGSISLAVRRLTEKESTEAMLANKLKDIIVQLLKLADF